LPRATGLAALLKKELNVTVTLQEGDRGEFTVWVGERCIADKNLKECSEFPDTHELVEKASLLLGK